MASPPTRFPFVQFAYHVRDVEAAAHDWARRFGAGPFFLREHIRLVWAEHRGRPADFVHTSAYGQLGELMIELTRQEDDTPDSPYREVFAVHEEGLHHAAVMVQDVEQALEHFSDAGMPVLTRCGLVRRNQVDFAFVDSRPLLGHLIEVYPETEGLLAFYRRVRDAARDWDGSRPLRPITD